MISLQEQQLSRQISWYKSFQMFLLFLWSSTIYKFKAKLKQVERQGLRTVMDKAPK